MSTPIATAPVPPAAALVIGAAPAELGVVAYLESYAAHFGIVPRTGLLREIGLQAEAVAGNLAARQHEE